MMRIRISLRRRRSMYRIETPKDLRKCIRSILQLSVLLFVLYILIRVFVTFNEYRPYNENM